MISVKFSSKDIMAGRLMQYHEYLNSARKHQYTCEEVLKLIKGIELTSGEGKSRHKRLLLNLYYLSGYVVECSVKYAIYHLIAYDRKKCVRQLDQDGISFQNNIKHHRFEMYADHLKVRQPGMPLIDDSSNVERDVLFIYRLWDAEVRYWFNDIPEAHKRKLTERNIEQFYNLATQLMKQVERI
ncbi:TPA: hypothetical protein NKP43_004463 [Vibrio parahaemolyticus]|uniref:hypothetical protein n=1 Tax=Vibrio TaxID=662 RepID=UPI00215E3ACF|nr:MULTISPECIES: hypothetical protein [Vibrio harveyi group]ELX9694005.1 hypothetical protein [Vibrio fluvialis]EMB2644357.1 hypothetical protein [Vibrio cholerae]EJG1182440.1 hypothetical protein [Vibrio parahaemolyticus]ELB2052051.1 hypothetical protein [Vibrio parahaemolyticus]MCS0108612.1 hypothetical protein [Vibrio alginolyticus]